MAGLNLSSGQRGRLPTELYREIVQYIQGRTNLFSLLTVSHLLSNEAERVLYRTIIITQVDPQHGALCNGAIPAARFSHCKRVAHYVRSATFSGICDTTVQHFLIPILLSLTKIKALTLQFAWPGKHTPFIYFLNGNLPFHLFELTIHGYNGNDALLPLLRSQSTLKKLSWICNTDQTVPISLSQSDLPHLTTFTTNSPSLFINAILPGRNVTELDCRKGQYNFGHRFKLGATYPSVRKLALSVSQDLDRIPILFPNIQYLFLGDVYSLDETLFPHLNLFQHLNRLKMAIPTYITPSRAFASKLFACNKLITIVELINQGTLLKFKRGFEKDESLVLLERVANVRDLGP